MRVLLVVRLFAPTLRRDTMNEYFPSGDSENTPLLTPAPRFQLVQIRAHGPFIPAWRRQVQDAEERSLKALEDKSGAKRLAELRKALLAKEQKMRTLREALVKLKQVRRRRPRFKRNSQQPDMKAFLGYAASTGFGFVLIAVCHPGVREKARDSPMGKELDAAGYKLVLSKSRL